MRPECLGGQFQEDLKCQAQEFRLCPLQMVWQIQDEWPHLIVGPKAPWVKATVSSCPLNQTLHNARRGLRAASAPSSLSSLMRSDPQCTHLAREAGRGGTCWAQTSKTLHPGPHREGAIVPAGPLPSCAVLGKLFSSLCLSPLICRMGIRQHLP